MFLCFAPFRRFFHHCWSVIDGGLFRNLKDFDVQTAIKEGRSVFFTGPIEFGDLGLGKPQTGIVGLVSP